MENRSLNDVAFIAGAWPLSNNLPTLIFIHGAGLSASLFDAQVSGLGQTANTIAIDLPGHGRSGGEAFDKISEYAGAVMSFINEINAPRPVICGLSMGGAVALDLLIAYPDVFSAGILMHTGARLKVHPMIFETLEKGREGYLELMSQFAVGPGVNKAHITDKIRQIASPAVAVVAKDFTACDGFNRMDDLSRIRKPVLVVTGSDDNITPSKYGEYLATGIGGARLEQVSGAGHLSPIEKPDAVNRIIQQFIRQI